MVAETRGSSKKGIFTDSKHKKKSSGKGKRTHPASSPKKASSLAPLSATQIEPPVGRPPGRQSQRPTRRSVRLMLRDIPDIPDENAAPHPPPAPSSLLAPFASKQAQHGNAQHTVDEVVSALPSRPTAGKAATRRRRRGPSAASRAKPASPPPPPQLPPNAPDFSGSAYTLVDFGSQKDVFESPTPHMTERTASTFLPPKAQRNALGVAF